MLFTFRCFLLLCFFTICIIDINARSIHEDSVYQTIPDPFQSGDENIFTTLANYRHRLERSMNVKKLRWAFNSLNATALCDACDLLVPEMRLLIKINRSDLIDDVAVQFCKYYKLLDENVCNGAVNEYKTVVIEVLRLSSVTNKELCSLAFECEAPKGTPLITWNITLPDKPKPTPSPPQPPTPGSPRLNVLHLSDIHVDFAYKPGSQADCPQPLCCRGGQPAPGHTGAGFWGDYRNCDIPTWTAEVILKYAAELEKVDFIYYTGDTPAHNVWNQSHSDQIYSITTINDMLASIFPNKTFYSAVGNHESAPCNLFPPPYIKSDNISWLYQTLADSWIKLGLPDDTRDSIEQGAFYTTLIRPSLRLISLNMNYCSRENFWLLVNTTDPVGQLQWLVQWLQYAEDHEEKVHIIGHHPPHSCLPSFSWNFYRIINRYENTIAGQFYGHTHYDGFIMFYDEIDQKRPVSMGFTAPSLTTSSYLNPGYRVYSIDGDYSGSSYWTLDYRTVIMNLTATNQYNRTIIIDEYDARDAYQMENLFPNDWNNLVQRLANDLDGPLMGLIYQYYTKSYANGADCDHKCRRGLLCSFITARNSDPHSCDSLPQ